jgi:dihydrolipoamide dehydrogenase
MATNFDLVILGSGPGGYVGAIRASQLGIKVAIVERELLGGICLNWGCIPTKALLRSSEIYHYISHAEAYGLGTQNPTYDLARVVQRSRKVADQLSGGVKGLMKKHKITVFEGVGKLLSANKVEVAKGEQKTVVEGRKIIVATGARARDLPFAPADGKKIWTYRTAMTPPEMPTNLLVIGSGAIGLEFASFYSDMGAKVTVIEMLDRILPVEDAEISAFMEKQLKKFGMNVRTSTGLRKLEATATGVIAEIKAKDGSVTTEEFSHAIVAIGIVPNTENIGLEERGVKTDRGHIVIDPYGKTSAEGIYAFGDVTGAPWLAHKAMHEAVICVEALAGLHPHAMDVLNIPGCTYSRPQVASVGLTEAKAKAAGYAVKIGKFPFIGNGKAIACGETEGFVKTVFDEATGELLGAHMIGAEVTEMIQGYVVGKTLETTEVELMGTVFPHPTISEVMHESVLSAYGRALHI